jgi:hypothetical protein
MTPIRKVALKRLIYICLGILLMVAFPDTKGASLYIGIFGVLVVLYQVIRILTVSQLLFDDLFPITKGKAEGDLFSNKVVYMLAMAIFFLGPIFYVTQDTPIENTIKGGQLFWRSAFLGLLGSVGLVLLLKRIFPTLLNETNRRFSVLWGFMIGFFLFVPAAVSVVNRRFAPAGVDTEGFLIVEKFTIGRNNSSYHVKLDIRGEVERFKISKKTYDGVSIGDSLRLTMNHGFLGYDFVEEFSFVSGK